MNKRGIFFNVLIGIVILISCGRHSEPKDFTVYTTIKGNVVFDTGYDSTAVNKVDLIRFISRDGFERYNDPPFYDQIIIHKDGSFHKEYTELTMDYAHTIGISNDSVASSYYYIRPGEVNDYTLLVEKLCKLKVTVKNDSLKHKGIYLQVISDNRIYQSFRIWEQVEDTTIYFKAFANHYCKLVTGLRSPDIPEYFFDSVYVEPVDTMQIEIVY